MLTIETERRISKFLITLSEEELKIQSIKDTLINDNNFNPYQCFKFLDRGSKEAIDCYDIFNYMKENSKYITLHESLLIILYYDTNDQNFWSYENFINFLIHGVVETTDVRYNFFKNNKNTNITKSIKNLILNIFESELNLINKTIPLVQKIKERYDYSIVDLFKSITNNCDIDIKNLKEFMIRNGYDDLSNMKLNAILNRLSLGKSNLVTLCDIQRLFEVGYCDNIKKDLYESMLNCPKNFLENGFIINEYNNNDDENIDKDKNSINKNYNNKDNNKDNLSNNYNNDINNSFNNNNSFLSTQIEKFKDNNIYNNNYDYIQNNNNNYINSIENKNFDINKNQNNDYNIIIPNLIYFNNNKNNNNIINNKNNENLYDDDYINNLNNNKDIYNNDKEYDDKLSNNILLTKQRYKILDEIIDRNNNNIYDNLDIPEEKYFVDYLEYILRNEILIEKKKIELALRADFNIEDCIKIFKTNQLNEQFISLEEFIYGTQSLNLKFNTEEIKLFFNKYDLMNNGYLSFSDFFDMIVPFNSKYREMVENRQTMPYKPKYKTNEIFLESTINYLKNVLQCICISETNIENERHKLINTFNVMSLDKIFYKIDIDKKGYIIPKDLLYYLKSWNVTILDSDSDLIFIRMDRDRNGIITLDDIIKETSLVLS